MAALFAACNPPPDPCTTPRTGLEESCDVVDGGNWRFAEGEPKPEVQEYCASQCVDFYGHLAISGQSDLSQVPILPKLRKVYSLAINTDGLTDLSGLERVDVISRMWISSGTSTSFRSLSGFVDEDAEIFQIDGVRGLLNLSSLSLKRVGSLAASNSGLVDIDVSNLEMQHFSIQQNPELRSVRLPSTPLKSVMVSSNPVLAELTWGQGLKVTSSLYLSGNPSLSSCSAQQFADETAPDAGRILLVSGNGPCP